MRPALRVSALIFFAVALAASGIAHAQQIGPGAVAGPQNVAAGTTTVVGGTTITSTAANHGVNVTGTGLVVFDSTIGPGPIAVATVNGNALNANGGDITVLDGGANFLTLTTGGGHAVLANTSPSLVTLNHVNISTTGVGSALAAIGGTIDATNVVINNTGTSSNAHGAIAESGGTVNLHAGTSITTAAFNSVGIGASGANSQVVADALIPVTLTGGGNMGVYMHDGGLVHLLPGSTLDLQGPGSSGIVADNTTVALGTIGSGLTINLGGTAPPRPTASVGMVAVNGANLSSADVTVTGPNAGGGAWAKVGSTINITGNSVINIANAASPSSYTLATANLVTPAGNVGSIFTVQGALPAAGLMARQGIINSTGTTINVTAGNGSAGANTAGAGSLINMTNNTITTTGTNSFGVRIDSGDVTAVGSSITTSGGGAALFYNFGPGTIDITDTDVLGAGPNTSGLFSLNGTPGSLHTFAMSGGSLVSEQEVAIGAQGPLTATIADGAVVTGGELLLGAFNQSSFFPRPTVVNLTASTGSVLTGDALAEDQSVANMTLNTNAHWTGAAIPVTNVTVNDTAIWTITANSVVRELTHNAGLIEFTPPAGGAFKTLTTQNWVGAGGVLGLNTYLGDDSSPSDLLIIDGGNASGNAGIRVTNAGGPGAQTLVDGILVVDTINDGTTNTNAFTLSGRAVAGPFEYFLFRGGQTITPENENNWYLRSEALDCSDPNAPRPPCPEPPPPPPPPPCDPETDPDCPVPPPPPPVIRPEVPAYLGNIRAGLGMMIHTLHERIGEPQYANDQRPENPDDELDTWWLRVVGRYSDVDPHGTFGFDAMTHTWLIQGGIELADWDVNDRDEDDRVHFGAMFSYGHANTDASSLNNPYRAEGGVDGYMVGAYATWYENDKEKVGLYMDAWGQFGVFDNEVQGDLLPLEGYTGYVLAVSLESGYAIRVDDDDMLFIEPQVQLAYLQSLQDELIEANGTRVADLDIGVPLTRLGVRAHDTWIDEDSKYQPYLEFNWWHDFAGERVTMNRVSFDRGVPEDRFDVGAGLDVKIDRDWTLWANAEYQWGDHWEGVEGMIGVKAVW